MEGSRKKVFKEQNRGTNTYPIHVIKNTWKKHVFFPQTINQKHS